MFPDRPSSHARVLQLGGPCLRKALQAELRDAIGSPPRVPGDPRVAGHVDDRPAALDHRRQKFLDEHKRRDQVDVQRAPEILKRVIEEVRHGRGP